MTETALPHDHSEGNPDQHAGGPALEPLSESEHPTHKHDHDPAHDNSPEAVRKEIRKYLMVFGGLAVLTIITVGISQLHLPTWQAVTLALVVATIKGSLVAAFFMHLISERKLIYAVLVMTVIFFGLMIWGPLHHRANAADSWPGYDINANKPAPTTTAAPHSNTGSGH
ncbi:MAG TPA: cytochrome C oxidase subunit IV family protein [Thermoanaerobaculia bacterium]|jgi:cytochrome c oxidase subunit 4|nr:cytochrome C oxidase subunit IV family protein [Thermoanaerobaculia bacterium]